MFTIWPHIVFWASVAGISSAYVFYPLVCGWIARSWPRPLSKKNDTPLPTLTVIIVAYNEAGRLPVRISNLLSSDYPKEKLSVLIIDDGSTDATAAVFDTIADRRVRLLKLPVRKGKPAALNAGLAACSSEICVLGDARQTFSPDTIRRLAEVFSDPGVGAISGELEIAASASGTGMGISAYWKRERQLRADEAKSDSCIGCTGACYAIRRSEFEPLPEDTLLDDVVIPLRIAARGYRILHDSRALAFDEQPQEPELEARRKRRTLAGNFQMLFRYPAWLFPGGHRLWWRIIAHKYLRIAAPLLLCGAAIGALALCSSVFYRISLYLQALCYGFGLFGILSGSRWKVFSYPAGFLFLNSMVVIAFFDYITGRSTTKWATAKPAGKVAGVKIPDLDTSKHHE